MSVGSQEPRLPAGGRFTVRSPRKGWSRRVHAEQFGLGKQLGDSLTSLFRNALHFET